MRGGFQGEERAMWLSAVGLGAAGAELWAEGLAADEAERSGVPPARSQRKPRRCLKGGQGSVGWESEPAAPSTAWCPSRATVGSGGASAQTSSPLGGCQAGLG